MNKNIKNMCKELKREFRSEYGMGNNLFIDAVDLTDCYMMTIILMKQC